MREAVCAVWMVAVLVWQGQAKDAAAAPADLGELQSVLARTVAGTRAPGASWGVQVVSLKTGAVWFETNATRLFVPASNSKLFTVALALDRFGADHRFQTVFRAAAKPGPDGVLAGDLWVEGGGDPSPGGGAMELSELGTFREALTQAGVRSIRGGLRLRGGWFDTAPYGAGWNWDDLPEAYGAPVGAFVFGDNAVRVVFRAGARPGDAVRVSTEPLGDVFDIVSRVRTGPTNRESRVVLRRLPGSRRLEAWGEVRGGSMYAERMAVPDGDVWFGRALRETLMSGGIPVMGGLDVSVDGEIPATVLATVPSLPMSELAALCLKPSNNLLAHQLWLHVGADVRRRPRAGDKVSVGDDGDRAAAAMTRFAAGFGVSGDELVMEEGSGLSRKNLVTPRATTRLVRHMAGNAAMASVYKTALPVGGVDGTLKNRFKEAPLKGNVQAKTGTLRHVNALAGHLTTAGGQPLVFAIYVNGFQAADAGASGRVEMDRMVEALARFTGQGPE
jgi:D-alanyl-D-alanine carboxypeptidase/D-alanyl-D-alanine-endopeptidase (penicillin-binding protein 4)